MNIEVLGAHGWHNFDWLDNITEDEFSISLKDNDSQKVGSINISYRWNYDKSIEKILIKNNLGDKEFAKQVFCKLIDETNIG